MRLPERLYRRMLVAYPPGFRRDYADGMIELFCARHERARAEGFRARARFWIEILRDLLQTAPAERLAAPRPPLRPRKRKDSLVASLWQDVKHAVRRLADAPGFTLTALLIVGLGIGANVAMFSVVETFLFRPPPWEDVSGLAWVYQDSDDGEPNSCSFPAFRDVTAATDVFASTGAFITMRNARLISDAGDAQLVNVTYATSGLFPTLGITPSRGRWLSSDADAPGGEPVAVMAHRVWQQRFESDPDVVGRSLRINGEAVTVIGVGPEGYGGEMPGVDTDFWLSISASGPVGGDYYWNTLERREDHWFLVVGRLADGVSASQAQAAMDVLAERLAAEYPEFNEGRAITVFSAADVRLHPEYDAMLFPTGAVLMTVVGLVLLIACGNLANLLLARASTRGREIAVRLALGATRARLLRQLLTESLLLSLGGGIVGVGVAAACGRWLVSYTPPVPMPLNVAITLDGRILGFALALSVATGLVFGLVPALRASRPDLVPRLKEQEGPAPRFHALRLFGLRNVLVASQVAVSFVLLIGAGLLVRSLVNAETTDLGFTDHGLALLQADVSEAGYENEAGRALFHQLRDRVEGLAGVDDVALASRLPVTNTGGSNTLEIEGYEPAAGSGTGKAEVIYAYVDTAYFRTVGIPLLHGRLLDDTDREDTPRVAVVNEAFARKYWGVSDAVGRRYRHEGAPDSWVRVIGVVADAKVRAPHEAPTPLFYRPLTQGVALTRLYVVARTQADPAALVGVMRDELRELDALVPVYQAGTIGDHVEVSLGLPRAAASVVGFFGALALMLATLGLYAVVSFTVSRRTTEMGIRIALGASGKRVVMTVLRETCAVVAAGLAAGIALSLLAAPVLESVLYGVEASDPVTFAAMASFMALVAAAAAYVPARRAARTDPVRTLRFE